MKKYRYIILIVLSSLFLSSCKMLKDIDISGKIYEEIFVKLNTFLHVLYPNLSGGFGNLVRAVSILIICCVAIGWAYGNVSKTKEVGISVILVSIFFPFLYDGNQYFNWVVNPVLAQITSLCDFFVQEISSKDTLGTSLKGYKALFLKLDSMFYTITHTLQNIQLDGGIWNKFLFKVAAEIGSMLLIAIYAVLYIAFLAIFIIATFALHIYFLIGGIMIFFVSFKRTRHLCWAWCKAVANQGLVMIFASIVMSLCIFAIEASLDTFAKNAASAGIFFTIDFLVLVLWCVACFIMLLKVPDLSATISGGMAGSTSDIVRTVSTLGGAAVGGASYAGGKLVKGAKAGGKAAGRMGAKAYSSLMGLKNK